MCNIDNDVVTEIIDASIGFSEQARRDVWERLIASPNSLK